MSTVNLPPIQDVQLLRMLQESSVTQLKNDPQVKSYLDQLSPTDRNLVNAYIDFRTTGKAPDYTSIKMTQPAGADARNEGFSSNSAASTATGANAPPKTPEQQDWEDRMKDYEARSKERTDALQLNREIDKENKQIDSDVAFLEGAKPHLDFFARVLDLDSLFTADERVGYGGHPDPSVRAAAQWLHGLNADQLRLLGITKRSDGSFARSDLSRALGAIDQKVNQLKLQKREPVEVPPQPERPARTTQNPSVGTPPGGTQPPGTNPPPTTNPPISTNPPGNATPPAPDPAAGPKPPNAEGSKHPYLDAIPPFSSNATTGEGRLLDAIDNMQARMDALEKDMAAAGDNPGLMQRLNAMYTKMNTAMSMFTQLLKQRTEMMNNMQKMYSEMAMSAIRNMR